MNSSNNNIKIVLENMQNDIAEIKNMLNLLTRNTKKELILSTLNSDEKILAYYLSDGKKSTREIANIVNMNMNTVSRWWREWKILGIVNEVLNGRRVKKLFSLEELGIEVPKIQNDDFYGVNNIPNRSDLNNILSDEKIFSNNDLYNTINKIYKINLDDTDKKYLISYILDRYGNSNNKEKLMLIQALKQIVMDSNTEFLNYFKIWEQNIKGQI